jgi:hypothetical protein
VAQLRRGEPLRPPPRGRRQQRARLPRSRASSRDRGGDSHQVHSMGAASRTTLTNHETRGGTNMKVYRRSVVVKWSYDAFVGESPSMGLYLCYFCKKVRRR